MRTLEEFLLLGSETLTLWGRYFLRMGSWFCLGFGLHHLGTQLSPIIGGGQPLFATLVFVLGVLAWLTALILMIHSLKPGLRTPRQMKRKKRRSASGLPIPTQLFHAERRLDVLTSAIGPFLAVYAVWGFIDDEVRGLFFANISQSGLGDVERWSISFAPERLPFYAVLAVIAWLCSKIADWLAGRWPHPWVTVPGVILDGTAVFAAFMSLGAIATQIGRWWDERVLAVQLHAVWMRVLDLLPDWQVWYDLTLPEAVRAALSWIWHTLLPGIADGVLLPLMWLALTATVFGWREFRGTDVVAGTRWQDTAGRIGRVAEHQRTGTVPVLVALATDDLRTKYLPVANALRLIWRTGPRFLGAYLVLAAVLRLAETWFSIAITMIIGPQTLASTFVIDTFIELGTGLLFTTLSVALYAAAFDRGMADVTGAQWRRERIKRATRVQT